MRAPLLKSSDVMMRDKAETEADLGTRLPGEALGFSTPSLWQLSRRLLPGSKPRGAEFLVPVLLLRRRMRFRLTRSADSDEVFTPESGSPSTNLGRSGLAGATQGLSSSEEKANLGMVSRL